MSYNQTIKNQLFLLKLNGALEGFEKQINQQMYHGLSYEERLTDLLQSEIQYKKRKKVETLLKKSNLKYKTASLTDVDLRSERRINISLFNLLLDCQWMKEGKNLIITGSTGCGKTWLSCAFGNQAIMNNLSVLFTRINYLTTEISTSRANGSYLSYLEKLAKNQVIILDDLFVSKMSLNDEYELLEIIELVVQKCSLILTSQYAVKDWYSQFNNPTLADAILDRIVHNAYRIELFATQSKRKKENLMGKFLNDKEKLVIQNEIAKL